jgi:hypothetical protein
MTGGVVVPVALDIVSKALGRPPTALEAADLAPIAVMVQAFIASAEPGDTLTFENEQWVRSLLWGLHESHGQKQQVQIEKAVRS